MAQPPIKVMVVDDTNHVRRMLRSMLELDGFDVVADAGSGAEAVEVVEAADPDVVVVDFKMPGMDGLETAAGIRARRPEQVLVMYTAFLDEDLRQRARDAGVAVVLDKVEGLESLEREITRMCRELF